MDFDLTTGTITPNNTTVLSTGGTGAFDVPSGTTAQRPLSPANGCIRYNSDIATIEVFIAGTWNPQAISGQINAAKVASTGNVVLTAPGATIDGITMVSGDRVLLWQQTTASQNGVYTWLGAAVTMVRTSDMNSNWDINVPGRNILIDQGTTYASFTFFCVSPVGGTYNTTAMNWSGDFYQVGKILFGNSATVTRASSGGFGMRNFTLLDTNASLRTWRFIPAITGGNSAGIEMIIGDNSDLASTSNYWWDISAHSDSQESVRIARRTGGVIAPKWIVDLNGRMTVGDTILASGATGAALASTAGVVSYFNSTDAIRIPAGTTAQRPTGIQGLLRFNSSLGHIEVNNGTTWSGISTGYSILQLINGSFTAASGTTSIPFDNTVPTSTEGTQVWSQAITPSSTSSVIEINYSSIIDVSSAGSYITVALFRGTTCIDVKSYRSINGILSATGPVPVSASLIDSPATASSITYSIRVGRDAAGTWYFGRAAGATYGGDSVGDYILKEIIA